MEPSGWGWALGGMLSANVLIAMMSTWVRAIVEVRRSSPVHPWRMVIATSLFNAGPWALVVAGIFIFYESSAPWILWFVGGAVAWILYMGIVVGSVMWKQRRRKSEENAA